MTTDHERRISIKNARGFLYALLDPKLTPKVPRSIRMQARWILKHYPWDLYLDAKECWWCGYIGRGKKK